MRHLTGIDVKLVRRLAIAPSNLAYSSERTIAIILSSSVSLPWLLLEVELDGAPSLGNTCHFQPSSCQYNEFYNNVDTLNILKKTQKS
jgi:hypothetical protein